MMVAIWVFIGGGLGSLARFGVGKMASVCFTTQFPLGTFISNLVACILLAMIVNLIPSKLLEENSWVTPLMVVGFCGGFSTFSTFSYENVQLLTTGNIFWGIVNILTSIAAGILVILLFKQKIGS